MRLLQGETVARFGIGQTDLTATTHHLGAYGVLNAVGIEMAAKQEVHELIAV